MLDYSYCVNRVEHNQLLWVFDIFKLQFLPVRTVLGVSFHVLFIIEFDKSLIDL